MVWFCMVWYGLVRFDMVWYGLVWFVLVGEGGGYVWKCSRMFHGGGWWWYIAIIVSTQIELERTWEASRVDLEMVWTRV